MTGTPWLSVLGNDYFHTLSSAGIYVEDREGDLHEQINAMRDDFPGECSLSYYSHGDLKLPYASPTPDIFDAAIESGANIVPYGITMRTLIQHPKAFRNGLLTRLFGRPVPFKSCLIGIKPLVGRSGRKYVVELAEKHFRFRMADEDVYFSDQEFWAFADKGVPEH